MNKGTSINDKSSIICDVGTFQCEDGSNVRKKRGGGPSNMIKIVSHLAGIKRL